LHQRVERDGRLDIESDDKLVPGYATRRPSSHALGRKAVQNDWTSHRRDKSGEDADSVVFVLPICTAGPANLSCLTSLASGPA